MSLALHPEEAKVTAEYLAGRKATTLQPGLRTYSDAVFEATRFDDRELAGITFRHVTFANVSFKNATIRDCTFENVVFLGSYFRNTVISSCDFAGCKFYDCDLTRVDLRNTRMKYYNRFHRTYVPFDRIRECLPEEGNLRQLLCTELAREAMEEGHPSDAAHFRTEAIRGEQRFLREVLLQRVPYYAKKYDLGDRMRAAGRLTQQAFFDVAWGRRKSHAVILRNWLLSAILFSMITAGVGWPYLGGDPTRAEAALYGFLTLFPGSQIFDFSIESSWLVVIVIIGRLLGLLLSGLFVALLFSRLYEGRR